MEEDTRMKKLKKLLSVFLALVLLISTGTVGNKVVLAENAGSNALTSEQLNAIAMLNYITVLTQDINASKNSRLYMEEAYSSLINNTYPSAVDDRTLNQMTGLLDIMEKYRMISVKRDRLQFIYEQNQAQAIRAAVPNPLGLMSAVQSFNMIDLAASVVYMAVDSATSYSQFKQEAGLQYIQDGWSLDDEEANTLHESRKGTFTYMINMAHEYDIPDDITLTENSVEEFVKWKNNPNVTGRIQFLESNQKTYQAYGGYWLLLAESYFNNEEYGKCLEAIKTYEEINARIFRKDYDYAKILPLIIEAADKECSEAEYVELASRYVEAITNNTNNDDWALRYFVAQTYVDLYERTKDNGYLEKAYSVSLDNVNYLVEEQRTLNTTYLSSVQEESVPKDATKEVKKQIEKYNKMLKENRKTELPPVYEPLQLNCELLFALAKELNISDTDKKRVDGILHPSGDPLFLTKALDELYWFNPVISDANSESDADELEEIDFAGNAVRIPVIFLSDDYNVEVSVKGKGASEASVYTDWSVDRVSRGKKEGIEEWTAILTSKEIKDYDWEPDAEIRISVLPKAETSMDSIYAEFMSTGTKNAWYDYLKVWEGHNDDWYDYLKVWENKVQFERKQE